MYCQIENLKIVESQSAKLSSNKTHNNNISSKFSALENNSYYNSNYADIVRTPTIAPFDSSINELSDVGEVSEHRELPKVTPINVNRKTTSNDIYIDARQFSNLSDPHIIKRLCQTKIPTWEGVSLEDIFVDQLMFGLSNQLFKVSLQDTETKYESVNPSKVLFRIYGNDVHSLYDLNTELMTFKALGDHGIAPKMIAQFDGGRIEEWIEGTPLLVSDMGKPSVLSGAALIIAGVHLTKLNFDYDTTRLDFFLDRWRARAMEILNSTKSTDPNYLPLQRLFLPNFYEESFKLKSYLFPRNTKITEVTKLVFCHNDIQENNIMLTTQNMRVIDFEYSGLNYPAFDIASYFWEMTCDYCVNTYPFFLHQPTNYPSLEKRRLFCAIYLKKILNKPVKIKDKALLDPVLDDVERFQLATNMLWGFWAVIRSPQAPTASQFDMLYYAQKRIDSYWTQKAYLIATKKIDA